MARHPFGPRAGRRARNRTYIVLALLIVAVLIAFRYGPFGKSEGETTEIENTPEVSVNTELPEEIEQEPQPTVALTPSPTPSLPPAPEPAPEILQEPNLPPEPTVEPNPEAGELIAKATSLIDERPSRIVEARDILNEAMRMPMSAQQRSGVKDQLAKLTDKWLFNRTVLPGDPLCESYRVRPGDRLSLIGERYKVPYEILMEINNIKQAEALQAGETIKVINGPFHATVYRSTFMMDVYLQNTYVRSFRVGLGKPGMETPTGLWRVKSGGKLVRPPWTNPIDGRTYHPEDPDYPLGSRWVGLEGLKGAAKERTGFAIHGTKEPEQIGSAGSQGCIRMHNGDAILVYNLLFPTFSQVEVTD